MKKIFYLFGIVLISMMIFSCSEEDLDPTLSTSKKLFIHNVEDLENVLNGAYDFMSSSSYYGRDYIIYGEVRSDNAYSNANSNRFVDVGQMNITKDVSYPRDTWGLIYSVIGNANLIIHQEASKLEGDEKRINQIRGQAYALRAMAHFDLLRLYGQQYVGNDKLGVPYITTFLDESHFFPARSSVTENKEMIYKDLDTAISLMVPDLDDPTKETLSFYAVYAIKARVANFFGEDKIAAESAKFIIDSGKYQIAEAEDFAKTFKTDAASNSIFEIGMTATDSPSINGLANIYRGSYGDICILQNLVDIYTKDDIRGSETFIKNDGTTIRNVGKYPTMGNFDDNISVIRYEEIILIYAESILTSNPAESLIELNKIPAKRGAPAYTSATLDNILLERRKEFSFEGFRFYDLARTKRDIPLVDNTHQTHGGVKYGSYRYAFPIPNAETGANSNVVQNKGY